MPTVPIKDRTFAGLARLANGHFSDSNLAHLLYKAIEESAGFFRARGTPAVLKVVDVMGMMQARNWKLVPIISCQCLLVYGPDFVTLQCLHLERVTPTART